MKAVECQQEKCVAILLEHGADPNLADAGGNTALHLAVLSPNTTVAGLLLEHNANVDAQNQDGFTPLGLAASRQQEQMVEFLWKKDAERHAPEEQESGDLTDSPLREGEAAASCQEVQDFLLASSGSDATVKGVEDSVQRLEIEDTRLEAVVPQQSSWSEALQRDVQGSASVADPYRKLENECSNCMQQKAANRCWQEEWSSMREICEELQKRERQLEEEVAELKHHMEMNIVDRHQAEQYRREAIEEFIRVLGEIEEEGRLMLQNLCLDSRLQEGCLQAEQEMDKKPNLDVDGDRPKSR